MRATPCGLSHVMLLYFRGYYDGVFSMCDMKALISSARLLQYGTNLDVTSYKDGQRSTLNGVGFVGAYQYSIACVNRLMAAKRGSGEPAFALAASEPVALSCDQAMPQLNLIC